MMIIAIALLMVIGVLTGAGLSNANWDIRMSKLEDEEKEDGDNYKF